MQGSGVFPHQDLFLLGSKAEESPNVAAELCQQVGGSQTCSSRLNLLNNQLLTLVSAVKCGS